MKPAMLEAEVREVNHESRFAIANEKERRTDYAEVTCEAICQRFQRFDSLVNMSQG
jgi:hypothetical protein